MSDLPAERPAASNLLSRLVLGLALGLATFVAFGIWGDFRKMGDALAGFDLAILVPVLALSCANYGVRAVRWHVYLRAAGAPAPARTSIAVFLSGLAMSVTPGKLGEVIKVGLMGQATGAPGARTFPVVVTERLTDLFAVLLLVGLGVARLGGNLEVLLAGVAMTAGLFGLLATGPGTRLVFRAAGVLLRKKIAPGTADVAQAVQRRLLAPRMLVFGIALGVAAWFAEATGLWLVVQGFPAGALPLDAAVVIYAVGTLAGALSFLPGGLIATEATLAVLLAGEAFGSLGAEAAHSASIAATLLIRLATLWFAVALGVAGLLWTRSHLARRRSSGS